MNAPIQRRPLFFFVIFASAFLLMIFSVQGVTIISQALNRLGDPIAICGINGIAVMERSGTALPLLVAGVAGLTIFLTVVTRTIARSLSTGSSKK